MQEPKKIILANLPTPVQKAEFNGCSFLIKRDDFTGTEYSGNKVRQLEYLLYEAKRKKAKYVFTCGGLVSNHARATAFAAARLGIKSKLFLRGSDRKAPKGNLFLDKVIGAETKFITPEQYYKHRDEIMLEESKLYEKQGRKVYIIPEGGSNELGVWGYINCVKELTNQINIKSVKGILTACGSGGTTTGLLLGSALLNLNMKIFAVNVCDDAEYFRNRILELAEKFILLHKLKIKIDFNNLEIFDGYAKEGYTNIAPDKVKVIGEFVRSNGILLDPVYTGKAFYAYNDIFLKGNKKTNVMFIHTGGIFGVFAKQKNYLQLS